MRKVDRSRVKEPPILTAKDADDETELEKATTYYKNRGNSTKSFSFKRYKDRQVKAALHQLFHGKCAYCESSYTATQPVDVEHFRPKGRVQGEDNHDGYWWLAMKWENLLPSCTDCNRRRYQIIPMAVSQMAAHGDENLFNRCKVSLVGKGDLFPLRAGGVRADYDTQDLVNEKPLLLDPCIDNPGEHLSFDLADKLDISLVHPVSTSTAPPDPVSGTDVPEDITLLEQNAHTYNYDSRGYASIAIYGLNRLGLVQARTFHLVKLDFFLELLIDLAEVTSDIRSKIDDLDEENPEQDILDQITFLSGIEKKLNQMKIKIRNEIYSRAQPSSQYSELTKKWIEKKLSQLMPLSS